MTSYLPNRNQSMSSVKFILRDLVDLLAGFGGTDLLARSGGTDLLAGFGCSDLLAGFGGAGFEGTDIRLSY